MKVMSTLDKSSDVKLFSFNPMEVLGNRDLFFHIIGVDPIGKNLLEFKVRMHNKRTRTWEWDGMPLLTLRLVNKQWNEWLSVYVFNNAPKSRNRANPGYTFCRFDWYINPASKKAKRETGHRFKHLSNEWKTLMKHRTLDCSTVYSCKIIVD